MSARRHLAPWRPIKDQLVSHGDCKPVWFLVSLGAKIDTFFLRQREMRNSLSLNFYRMRGISRYSWSHKGTEACTPCILRTIPRALLLASRLTAIPERNGIPQACHLPCPPSPSLTMSAEAFSQNFQAPAAVQLKTSWGLDGSWEGKTPAVHEWTTISPVTLKTKILPRRACFPFPNYWCGFKLIPSYFWSIL